MGHLSLTPLGQEARPDIPPEVAQRAVEWLVDLQSGDATDTMRRAHRDWLAGHPDHARAWLHIEAVNQRLFGAAGSSAADAALAQAALAPPRSSRRRRAVKSLAVLLFAGTGAWQIERQWHMGDAAQGWLADERTGTGQRRTVMLADGGTVMLNSATAIDVRFGPTERRMQLLAGEVLVTTGHDASHAGPPRSFVVQTVHGELRPLGTRFAVRLRPGAIRVDVFEGAVAIHPSGPLRQPGGGAGPVRVVRAGERVHVTGGGVSAPQPANEDDVAWVEGMLVANGMRLAHFLEELGRHRPGRLACDPVVGHLRVSGTYPLADTDRVLDLLRTTLPVEVHFITRWWVTVRATQP